MSVNAAPARPGCGCGGSGGSDPGGSGCGCGGACGSGTLPANLTATAFVRPRFFAGQLLTEDDLSALIAYTTAKDRLHNRYLFGPGVVCGLWVSCDPCGGGTVTVQPGYALDCCGNDLVLPCAAPLDVNAMIRDLRATQLGKDCGDPCADQGKATSGRQSTAPIRRYCLYARYGEQKTDPVAPYATGEPCGQVACEPTRVREGISFILKCPVDTSPPDDLWTRMNKCVPNSNLLGQQARLKAYSGPMTAAAAGAEHPPVFSSEDAEELTKVRTGLAEMREAAGEEQIRSATEKVRRLAALIARYDLARDRAEYTDIADARKELGQTAAALAGSSAVARYEPLDQPAVNALLEQAALLTDRPGTLPQVRLAMLAQGRPLDDSVLAALASDAAAVLGWLLDRLDNDPTLADCELRSRAQTVSLPTPAEGETLQIRSLGRAGSELAALVAGVVRDCTCAAFDPPCASCEDPDVLLACLEVCDCTVVRICNAERDYVISGSALRYWLPTGPLHEWLEFVCCPPERCRDAARAETGRLAFSEAGFGTGERVAATPWELLELRNPAHALGDAMGRAGAARAAPAVPEPSAAGGADADAAAQQVAALAERVAELAEQLTQSQARLDTTEAKLAETQADLRRTQASVDASGRQSQAVPASPGQARARQRRQESQDVPASPGQARTRQRRPAARRSAAASLPVAAGAANGDQEAGTDQGAVEAPAPADAGTSQADAGEAVAGPDVPETSDDT
jgi:hypothetical protein